jgi:hypothetical protein
VVAISLSVPVFGTRTGSTGGQGCQTCKGWYDPEYQTSIIYCGEPASGSSGNTKCTVKCSTIAGEMGSCSCFDEGDWCYYISVTG